MSRALAAALTLALAGCQALEPTQPTAADCKEFDYGTTHDGKPTRCRMIWCESSSLSTNGSMRYTGSMATLWCDEVPGP